VIVDPGAPAVYTDRARNFVASVYQDVLGRFPSAAELESRAQELSRGAPRLRVARAIWTSDEHRRLQVDRWSAQFLGHAADRREEARWVTLLRRKRGELAVEQAILTSPEYRRAHPMTASFIAGLNHEVLGQASNPSGTPNGPGRQRIGRIVADKLARRVLTSPAAAANLAQQYAMTFLGRPAIAQERRLDERESTRGPDAPARIAERILASDAFFEVVNSALPAIARSPAKTRSTHSSTRHS
jgi:hypothetical protein